MKVKRKIIIVGVVMILHALQKGVLSQEPLPFKCYQDIKDVGEIFCKITGQRRFMNIIWQDLVLMCTTAYSNLSIPFKVTEDQIVICPDDLEKKFDTWKREWLRNEIQAKNDMCNCTEKHR
uniref:Putative salivary secreted protein n=1 Tax=Ixodes ricinus TaxID=34613 RepID=A0A090X9K6_IXORI